MLLFQFLIRYSKTFFIDIISKLWLKFQFLIRYSKTWFSGLISASSSCFNSSLGILKQPIWTIDIYMNYSFNSSLGILKLNNIIPYENNPRKFQFLIRYSKTYRNSSGGCCVKLFQFLIRYSKTCAQYLDYNVKNIVSIPH